MNTVPKVQLGLFVLEHVKGVFASGFSSCPFSTQIRFLPRRNDACEHHWRQRCEDGTADYIGILKTNLLEGANVRKESEALPANGFAKRLFDAWSVDHLVFAQLPDVDLAINAPGLTATFVPCLGAMSPELRLYPSVGDLEVVEGDLLDNLAFDSCDLSGQSFFPLRVAS